MAYSGIAFEAEPTTKFAAFVAMIQMQCLLLGNDSATFAGWRSWPSRSRQSIASVVQFSSPFRIESMPFLVSGQNTLRIVSFPIVGIISSLLRVLRVMFSPSFLAPLRELLTPTTRTGARFISIRIGPSERGGVFAFETRSVRYEARRLMASRARKSSEVMGQSLRFSRNSTDDFHVQLSHKIGSK